MRTLMAVMLVGLVMAGIGGQAFAQPGTDSVFGGTDSRYLGFDPGGDAAQYLRDRKQLAHEGQPEVKVVRMAQQYGLGYLPLMIMRQNRLIEKHAAAAGLGAIQVTWSRFPSGAKMRDALFTGFLDFAAGGVAPFLEQWDTSADQGGIRAVAALESMPLFLNTTNAGVKTVADFGPDDRIAVPSVGNSLQAVILRMAAAQQFGPDQYDKLDPITVSVSHPKAMQDLLAGRDQLTAHLTSPPFQYQELADSRVHRVFTSYDIVGDKATFNLLWTRNRFYQDSPKTFRAVFAALAEAMALIKEKPVEAARIYLLQARPALSEEQLTEFITDPGTEYGIQPRHIMRYVEFMHSIGMIKNKPVNWQELFFPPVVEATKL